MIDVHNIHPYKRLASSFMVLCVWWRERQKETDRWRWLSSDRQGGGHVSLHTAPAADLTTCDWPTIDFQEHEKGFSSFRKQPHTVHSHRKDWIALLLHYILELLVFLNACSLLQMLIIYSIMRNILQEYKNYVYILGLSHSSQLLSSPRHSSQFQPLLNLQNQPPSS